MMPADVTESFGDIVKRLRKARGLTQQQLAQALGLNHNTIYNIESGLTRAPYWQTVKSLADYFRVAVESLGVKEEPVPRQRKLPTPG
jgi:transcriptional regulator with XRE-family HTH domain